MRTKDPTKESLILEAALQLASEQGISGLSMANVAKKANLATGTLYLYFADKEALFRILYQKLKREAAARIVANVNFQQAPRQVLRNLWKNDISSRLAYPREVRFLEQYRQFHGNQAAQSASTQDFQNEIFPVFERAKKDGELKDLPNAFLLEVFTGAAQAVTRYLQTSRQGSESPLVEEGFTYCWQGLRAPEKRG